MANIKKLVVGQKLYTTYKVQLGNTKARTLHLSEAEILSIEDGLVKVRINSRLDTLNEKRLKVWKTKKPELETTEMGITRIKTKTK